MSVKKRSATNNIKIVKNGTTLSVKPSTASTIISWSQSCWPLASDCRLFHGYAAFSQIFAVNRFIKLRRQSVKIDNFQSDWGIKNAGVCQGTKLGPILFIIMINDLELASSSTDHWKYVDDVTISESLKKNKVSVLQSDLNTIERWIVNNKHEIERKEMQRNDSEFRL
ncbi:Hypothetical predicted protein [Paramuricea clavata]|uniref:Reverse transcriptase domain-containing protein n=2 Tax=Paramuricea clavata TaxID=317549 RepID=A0A7D9JPJ6_PARCT|nr:Hypothetical predicted protein [Paramuricea clavata]